MMNERLMCDGRISSRPRTRKGLSSMAMKRNIMSTQHQTQRHLIGSGKAGV